MNGSLRPSGGDKNRATSLLGSEKRTFKDKLHLMIQEAEQAEIQAIRENQLQDKKSISIQMLVDGRPEAFSDFFSLTHGRLDRIMGELPFDASTKEMPQESLSTLKNLLIAADDAKSLGDVRALFDTYKTLAIHFYKIGKLKFTQFFIQQCVRTGQDASWAEAQKEALLAMGVIRQLTGDVVGAIASYERRMDLLASDLAVIAEEQELAAAAAWREGGGGGGGGGSGLNGGSGIMNGGQLDEVDGSNFNTNDISGGVGGMTNDYYDDSPEAIESRKRAFIALGLRRDVGMRSLQSILLQQAMQFEAAEDLAAAAATYQQCLLVAERCDNVAAAARVHFQVGRMCHAQQRFHEGIASLRIFLDLCAQTSQEEAEREAAAAAAAA
eukprot:CAMPEP_0175048010 /NCGR_PEP_ID=MMETSP0052_2-20121109/5928_1 /TAXON_ID=51329 ORGANISM="Polytomella parva, Strain SAG 63-3" /NCGR_SAMPLE_ID=MMETSP0052_2 /ASSEMBLY_ACC=CAM_ASM_000194 /LENGTH=382 /DNA_ID=CAMNT_0016311979 /DNA_START=91 /DNA_END=1235 /DNA_ORIENTATION=-